MKSVVFQLFGGFLGSGKTTVIGKFVDWLRRVKRKTAAVITNDQGSGLIDTDLMRDANVSAEEIVGGCFCCRSDLLIALADKIVSDFDPDLIIAEPVGSCTDLMATVSLPILQIYKRPFDVGLLTVLVDPFRCERILNKVADTHADPENLDYIYLKQLEEAQVIVINKIDLLSEWRIASLRNHLSNRFKDAIIFEVSTRSGVGLNDLFEYLYTTRGKPSQIMELDYLRYAAGEAELAWINATYTLESELPLDFNDLGLAIVEQIVRQTLNSNVSVSHLKLRLASEQRDSIATVIQLVDNSRDPEFTSRSNKRSSDGRISLNLRALGDPKVLEEIVCSSFRIGCPKAELFEEALEAFSPAPPQPVHRVDSPNNGN